MNHHNPTVQHRKKENKKNRNKSSALKQIKNETQLQRLFASQIKQFSVKFSLSIRYFNFK